MTIKHRLRTSSLPTPTLQKNTTQFFQKILVQYVSSHNDQGDYGKWHRHSTLYYFYHLSSHITQNWDQNFHKSFIDQLSILGIIGNLKEMESPARISAITSNSVQETSWERGISKEFHCWLLLPCSFSSMNACRARRTHPSECFDCTMKNSRFDFVRQCH